MTYRDAQLTGKVETTYGTAVTTDRRILYLTESGFDYQPTDVESEELTFDVDASSQLYRPVLGAGGSIDVRTKAKGMGWLHKAGLGVGVSTLVSTGLYQQNASLLASGASPFLDSLTLQFAQKLVDNTDDVNTFLGCTVKSIEWKLENAQELVQSIEFDARTMSTAIGKASVAVPTGVNNFPFSGFSAFTGPLTEPTTTVMPVCATQLTAVKSFSIKLENDIVVDDYRGDATGLKGQPAVQGQTVTGQLVMDYNAQAQTLRNAWIANTATSLLFKLDNGVAIGAGTEQMIFALPDVRSTGQPTPNRDGKFPTITFAFKAYKPDASTSKLFVSARTADAAL